MLHSLFAVVKNSATYFGVIGPYLWVITRQIDYEDTENYGGYAYFGH